MAYDRSFKSFIEHFFEELFVWDSRALRSIKYLLIRPGFLTHEYISGRVNSYISPLKLFLFTSLVCFFIMIKSDPDVYKSFNSEEEQKTDDISMYLSRLQEESGKSKELYADNFNDQISDNITLYIFFIMLVFSLLLKAVYVTKKIYYVEHIVFTLHFFSFVLICLLAGTLLEPLWESGTVFFLFIFPAIYLFLALKTAYHKTIWKALVTSAFFTFSYWMLLIIWVFGTIFLSAVLA